MKNIITIVLLSMSCFAFAQETPEPFMKEIYFENKEGQRIEDAVSISEKFVYLVIVSENAIGEKVVLKMDEDEEYIYKRKFLAGGSSVKFKVKHDIQKVKLTIFNTNIKKHRRRQAKTLKNL